MHNSGAAILESTLHFNIWWISFLGVHTNFDCARSIKEISNLSDCNVWMTPGYQLSVKLTTTQSPMVKLSSLESHWTYLKLKLASGFFWEEIMKAQRSFLCFLKQWKERVPLIVIACVYLHNRPCSCCSTDSHSTKINLKQ